MSLTWHGHSKRHQSRIMAFEFLFAKLSYPGGVTTPEFDKAEFIDFNSKWHGHSNADDFAWSVVTGTGNNLPVIDESIIAVLEHWKIERPARIDLTILRLAGFEILFGGGLPGNDVPKTVAINEAVELAKTYGEKDSPSFINGILDKLTSHS